MDLKEFKEKLLVYGADVYKWPRGAREAGLKALENSAECRALLAEEESFEQVLKARRYEEPGSDLAERIISASQPKAKEARRSLGSFFSDLLREFGLPETGTYCAFCIILSFFYDWICRKFFKFDGVRVS